MNKIKRDVNMPRAKVNTKPGTLQHIGKKGKENVEIIVTEYNEDMYIIESKKDINELKFETNDSIKWINLIGLKDANIVRDIGEKFKLHTLLLEDVLNTYHKPKIEDYNNCTFVIAKLFRYYEEKNEIKSEQISFVLLKDILITFQEFPNSTFDNVIERIEEGSNIRKNNVDYLFYALIDAVVDSYFLVLEEIDNRIDLLEEQLISNPEKKVLQEVYELKRELIYIGNYIWPIRNILGSLTKNEFGIINEKNIYYFRDVHDHTIQIIDMVETYRDVLSGMIDTYLSSIGNKTNEVMKVLTIFSTIFIPLTFLSGVYGMNFTNIPEHKWKYGYLMFWGISAVTSIIMVRFFKKKGWL